MNIYINYLLCYTLLISGSMIATQTPQANQKSFDFIPELSLYILNRYLHENWTTKSNKEVQDILHQSHLVLIPQLHDTQQETYVQLLAYLLLIKYKYDTPIPRTFIYTLNNKRKKMGKPALLIESIYQRPSILDWWNRYRQSHYVSHTWLDLHGSPIDYLQSLDGLGLLSIAPDVERLNFAHHRFSSIEHTCGYLPRLRYLFLKHNEIIHIIPHAFQGCMNLHTVDLSYNNIQSLGTLFKGLKSLTTVILSNNKIEKLDSNTFEGCNQIQTINVNHNRLETVHHAFQYLSTLQRLYLTHNRIQEINANDLLQCSGLVSIDLSYNRIKQTTHLFGNLHHVRYIDLDYNCITTVGRNTCFNCPMLTRVQLQHNPITSIEQDAIANCPLLKKF